MRNSQYRGRGTACAGLILAVVLTTMTLTGSALASLVEEAVELPVEVTDARGRTFRQPIKVTIYRDDQRTKSPFLILNQ